MARWPNVQRRVFPGQAARPRGVQQWAGYLSGMPMEHGRLRVCATTCRCLSLDLVMPPQVWVVHAFVTNGGSNSSGGKLEAVV
mmetsp:Transcript_106762/g.212023  ORF Transcript_106762/g.212023 Transcript_106762/m.212023 type:complete len:83 (+) Transcript_106762:824-1072(+)